MKAILINSTTQTIEAIELNYGQFLTEAYRLLACSCVSASDVRDFDTPHSLYYDDEFRLHNGHMSGFAYNGVPFLGNGLITGFVPHTGDETFVQCTPEQVRAHVRWLTNAAVQAVKNEGAVMRVF